MLVLPPDSVLRHAGALIQVERGGAVHQVLGVEQPGAHQVAVARADVSAEPAEQRAGREAVLAGGVRERKLHGVPKLRAQLQIDRQRSDPAGLNTVDGEIGSQERLLHERGVDEVPGVRVHRVLVPDAGEEAQRLEGQPVTQRGRGDEGLFGSDGTVREGERGLGEEELVDVGGERQLSFVEIKAFVAFQVSPGGQIAGDAAGAGIGAILLIRTLEDQGYPWIEGVLHSCAGRSGGGLCGGGLGLFFDPPCLFFGPLRGCLCLIRGALGRGLRLLCPLFGLFEAVLQVLDAFLVVLLDCLDLLADLI